MGSNVPLFPTRASTVAGQVDALYFFAIGVSIVFSVLIVALIIYFIIRYRRRAQAEVGADVHGSTKLEIIWTVIPLGIVLFMFAWGAQVFFDISRPPSDASEFWVVGKQWMWKIQHPEGKREINELHVPLGRPVKLTMTSEDVIHSFFVPAFRVKADVLPGRYTTVWFEATRTGEFHLFCAEYCGTEHSKMIGTIVVMEPHDYEAWLAGGEQGPSMVASGEQLFEKHACNTCHRPDTDVRGPWLGGLFGTEVDLEGGRRVTADENYLRESILNPPAKIVAGYQPIMPTFKGLVSEEEVISLISYIKALGDGSEGAGDEAESGETESGEGAGDETDGSDTGAGETDDTTPIETEID
jgi:cytochrome c oxidase subunit 2